MAASNVTVDDSSSLIAYDPPDAWQGLSGSAAQAYANATMHGTAVSGASARFAFNGTGVWFYGAKKPEYGSFIMLVDDEVSGYANASAASPEFGQLLGGVSGLQDGQHVVSIMNGGTGPMDLDAIVFESVDQQQPKAIAHASAAQTSASGSQTLLPFLPQSRHPRTRPLRAALTRLHPPQACSPVLPRTHPHPTPASLRDPVPLKVQAPQTRTTGSPRGPSSESPSAA
ncbi:hypothetical protein PYCCODRAFT_1138206 [Trametes coccinea BRFM310]|uniref:Uncharacterized protein n=1 Tax=Trametes coccinea (strain BRFM310) TaxID=1353009 RepID=A0A1Y2IAM7_TRAC3|nr:hypothetical protein PYCCODRAFT_1138206 [Trametes coccinea BRFM310]